MFYDKKEILLKVNKLYDSSKVFIAFIENIDIFPYIIKLKKIKQIQEIEKLKVNLLYEEFNFKAIGKQKLPTEVMFKSRDELLKFIDKEDEFKKFVNNYKNIIKRYKSLKEIFKIKPKLIIQNIQNWDRLLSICDFFVLNPHASIYIRELSIKGVDTKFIEKKRAS